MWTVFACAFCSLHRLIVHICVYVCVCGGGGGGVFEQNERCCCLVWFVLFVLTLHEGGVSFFLVVLNRNEEGFDIT